MTKIRVGIIAGGQSSEHEISCISAAGILGAIDRNKFEPVLIGITKSGKWVLPAATTPLTIIDGQLPSIPEDSPLICADINEFSAHATPLNLSGATWPLWRGWHFSGNVRDGRISICRQRSSC